jgi:hypothetical protein
VTGRGLNARLDRFLDYLFFGALEVCVLTLPVLLALLVATPPAAVSLSAMTALGAGSLTVAILRGGYVGDRDWPRPGEIGSLPGRSAYYSLVVGGSTYGGVQAQLLTGSALAGVGVSTVVAVALVALLPPALDGLMRASRAEPPWI